LQQGKVNTLPSGTIDLLPTLLHVLDYPCPSSVEGRVLYEALAQTLAVPESAPETRTYSTETLTSAGLYRQHLTTTRVGTTVYLERGWVE
jgi:arylsulfatase A-like enzyme